MSEEKITREDEINLPPLKKITIQFLRFIFSVVDELLATIKEGRWLILTGIFTGLVVGFSYYSSRSNYYEVSMVAQSPSVYRKTIAEVVASLDKLIGSRSYSKLASELGISEQNAREVYRIAAIGMFDESLDNDTSTKVNQPFKIFARLQRSELADTFQHAIVDYINDRPFFKRVKEQQIAYYRDKLLFIDQELAKLDTLKREYNHFLASSKITSTYYSNDVDPSTIYKHSNDLFNEKGAIEVWLASNSNSVEVIDAFKSPSLPQSYSRTKSIAFGGLIGLGLCFLLALYLRLYRKIKIDK
ncbi:MAG TPA: hypothetical protein VG890_09905 [Puia sp.]|nr:hypothetical protein [Puia sp.]